MPPEFYHRAQGDRLRRRRYLPESVWEGDRLPGLCLIGNVLKVEIRLQLTALPAFQVSIVAFARSVSSHLGHHRRLKRPGHVVFHQGFCSSNRRCRNLMKSAAVQLRAGAEYEGAENLVALQPRSGVWAGASVIAAGW